MAKKPFYIKGIPISSKIKVSLVLIFFLLFVINSILPIYFEFMDYPGKNIVTLTFLALMVIVSIGSKSAEGIVIGIAIVALISNIWDIEVLDRSELRKHILTGSIAVLTFALVFGEIGILHVIHIVKRQFGAEK